MTPFLPFGDAVSLSLRIGPVTYTTLQCRDRQHTEKFARVIPDLRQASVRGEGNGLPVGYLWRISFYSSGTKRWNICLKGQM